MSQIDDQPIAREHRGARHALRGRGGARQARQLDSARDAGAARQLVDVVRIDELRGERDLGSSQELGGRIDLEHQVAGHWDGVREKYARAVVTTLCRIDHVGLAVSAAPDRKTPALAAFTARRFGLWPDAGSDPASPMAAARRMAVFL